MPGGTGEGKLYIEFRRKPTKKRKKGHLRFAEGRGSPISEKKEIRGKVEKWELLGTSRPPGAELRGDAAPRKVNYSLKDGFAAER